MLDKLRYEYWPWWLFFIPLLPLWLFYAFRARSLFYFTNVNPKIDLGGFFGESKIEILDDIPAEFKAETHFFKKGVISDAIQQAADQHKFVYPLIAKPDVGERGQDVEKIGSIEQLLEYSMKLKADFIVQEYVDYPVECGVFFVKEPNEDQGHVTSLTLKSFLSVIGDGISTVQELLHKHKRGKFYAHLYPIDRVLEDGVEEIIQPIGNHSLGTEFINGNEHITPLMSKTFDVICGKIPELYYGRFDLKVRSIAELERGETIKIFELNGVSSEPGHIYDRKYTLFKAYRDLATHWKHIYHISQQNKDRGFPPAQATVVLKRIKGHFF